MGSTEDSRTNVSGESPGMTICVCTYNSASTLRACLESVRAGAGESRLVVIDHHSRDSTADIAETFGAEIYQEDSGLGRARQMCFELTRTRLLVFIDSDVQVIQPSFFRSAETRLKSPTTGAVVGMAVGHRLAYGLPASLLALRHGDFTGRIIPDQIDSRETYFIQARLDALRLKTEYLADCIIHRSQYRRRKMEWEGANTRIAAGLSLGELFFCLKVIMLMSINSRSLRNVAYAPVSYFRFLRGFADPYRWNRLRRES